MSLSEQFMSEKYKLTSNLEPVYTTIFLGPANTDYIEPDSFTQVQVLELGKVIAHFKGPFAKINAGKFVRLKQREVNM